MKISFDPAKDEKTRVERGFSLALGVDVIRNQVALRLDDRRDYGEDRLISFGYVEERLFVCVYTVRGDTLHIISVRKANDREIKRYGRRS
ncbi:BrnT family toxin [Mesorhizobium sp. KR2-14]|uniref:BrnT family toxin n=1 Tax=Mesorhizobium sp. KR2-14 TaxID=3156610 RepID=UPI0032B41CB1